MLLASLWIKVYKEQRRQLPFVVSQVSLANINALWDDDLSHFSGKELCVTALTLSFQRQMSAQALEGEQDREQCVNRASFSFSKHLSHSGLMLKKTKGANYAIFHPT